MDEEERFILVRGSREEIRAAFGAAGLEVLAEGGVAELATFLGENRGELVEVGMVLVRGAGLPSPAPRR